MRSTIIPAQITTVEDKLVGSLNVTQVLILMIPVVWTTIVYAVFSPSMKLTPYKLVLIFIAIIVCIILVLRVKEKIVAQWLVVLLHYRLRPKYYLFNKNTLIGRPNDLLLTPTAEIHPIKNRVNKIEKEKLVPETAQLVRLEHLVNTGRVAVRYRYDSK